MKADICICTACQDMLIEKCLEAIDKHVDKSSIGDICICCTTDEALQKMLPLLKKYTESLSLSIKLTQQEYNFAKCNNALTKMCSSECVLFMNDDVILHSDAVTPCMKILEDKAFGAVGIKLLYGDGTIQHAGVFQFCNNLGICQGVGHIHFKEKNQVIPPYLVPGVTGAFLMMRTADFKKIGGFDERFKHCFEDVVLCKRIRDLGMQIVCNNDVEAVHYESQTRKQAMCREDFDLMLSILNGEER